MRTVLNRVITRMKGQAYTIDPGVDDGYLVRVVAERLVMKARGAVSFPTHDSRPFIGPGVGLRAKGKLSLGSNVTFARDSWVDALSTDGVELGDNTSVGRGTRIECTGRLTTLGRGLRAGRNVGLGTDCLYGAAGGISIGDDTIIGNYVTMHSENHVIDDLSVPIRDQGVTHLGIEIGPECWIGAKATILDGARIGRGCVIAAGSVVTAGTYADYGIFGGVPAKLIKSRRDPALDDTRRITLAEEF